MAFPDMFKWLDAVGGIRMTIYYLLIALPILLVLIWIVMFIRNKKIYRYKARIYQVREGGKHKELNYKAGYIMSIYAFAAITPPDKASG